MTDYYSYYGPAKDPTMKHNVANGCIETYYKDSVFFAFIERWKLSSRLSLHGNVEFPYELVQMERALSGDTKGFLTIKADGVDHTFYIFEKFPQFIAEVKSAMRR